MAKSDRRKNPVKLQYGMTIGSLSAEHDDAFLFECFVHYAPVSICMNPLTPGMILAGRTGAGKTAILRHIAHQQEKVQEIDPSEMAMSYVSNSDILTFVHNIGGDLDLFFQTLWKHVICIAYIRLRWSVGDETASRNFFQKLTERFHRDARKQKSIEYLKEWQNKFWVTMDENIKELTEKFEKKLEGEFGAEFHKAKLRGQYDKQIGTERKSELVKRTKRIINAEQLSDLAGVIDMLHEQEEEDKFGYSRTFYLLIDKLDERWVDTGIRFRLIRGLIEALRAFRRITNLKIVVALRTDIVERVLQETQDLSFQREKYDDYFIKMRWDRDLLQDLVRKRIRTLFRRQYSPTSTIEFEDVFPNKVGNQDPFDYMLERTLMRPRDMLAFVNQCLLTSEGNYEVSAAHIRQAEKEYSRVRKEALEQEWQSAFPTLRRLLDFIATPKRDSFEIEELMNGDAAEKLALEIAADTKKDFDPAFAAATAFVETCDQNTFVREILGMLYRVGAIGIKMRPNQRISYSHIDEPVAQSSMIPSGARVRIHPMLHAALVVTPS